MRFVTGFIFCLLLKETSSEWNRYSISGRAQGTTYSIIYYARDSVVTKGMIDYCLEQLDSSLSLYKPYSRINQFNKSEKGIVLDQHLLAVIKKSFVVNKKTDGFFDITVQPLVQAWGFGVTKTEVVPDDAAIKKILPCVNTKLLKLKGNKLVKKKPCVKIDLNGIAQGYSVDVLVALLEKRGVQNYIVELGGEIRVRGRKQPSGEKMKVGIESPEEDAFENHLLKKIVSLDKGAITTSGSYQKYYESNGKRITHLINPKTGYTHQNELISVTVYAKEAMTADAYDNALMVMGLEKALAFVEKRKDIAAHFIYKTTDGKIADTMSRRFSQLLQP